MEARLIRNNGHTWPSSNVAPREVAKGWRSKRQWEPNKDRRKAGKGSRFISRRKTDQKMTGGNEKGHMQAHVSANSDTPPPSGLQHKRKASPFCFFCHSACSFLFPPEGVNTEANGPNKCSPAEVWGQTLSVPSDQTDHIISWDNERRCCDITVTMNQACLTLLHLILDFKSCWRTFTSSYRWGYD